MMVRRFHSRSSLYLREFTPDTRQEVIAVTKQQVTSSGEGNAPPNNSLRP
jgi:hypothetical protein